MWAPKAQGRSERELQRELVAPSPVESRRAGNNGLSLNAQRVAYIWPQLTLESTDPDGNQSFMGECRGWRSRFHAVD